MDPITMMVASIGMQFFNNYANSDKNKEIQDKQREFQKAAAEHDFERMRKLQAESAKLALELEAEVHKERAEDINSNYDALLENFAHSFAIQNWPLNVLPFIMKGESFGSLFKGTTKSVNMHCIFTPSNCDWFNRMFYDDIDLRLEAEMNNNWNAQTTHPIVYYGGGWNRRTVLPHGISIPNLIDLDDIGLLETNLKNVPVMVVTPYFDPWLHFRVKIWGMGKDSEVPFRIDIPHGADIEFSKRIFSYDYNKDMKEEMTEDFINTTIEEFVPYMESLIGFVADKYFWGMYKVLPHLTDIKRMEILPITMQIAYDVQLEKYTHRSAYNIEKALDYCHIYKKQQAKKKVLFVLEKYFYEKGMEYDTSKSVYSNYTDCQIHLSDIPVIGKLQESGYLSEDEMRNLVGKTCIDNYIYVLSINELLDCIGSNQKHFDYFHFRILNGEVCVGFLTNKSVSPVPFVAILYKKIKPTNITYLYDIKNNQAKANKDFYSKILSIIPDTFFEPSDRASCTNLSLRIREKIELGLNIYKDDPSIIQNAISKRVTFDDLLSWIHSKKDGMIKIVQIIYEEQYYLLLLHLNMDEEILDKCSYKMFSIDEKIQMKFKNKIILTIKI